MEAPGHPGTGAAWAGQRGADGAPGAGAWPGRSEAADLRVLV